MIAHMTSDIAIVDAKQEDIDQFEYDGVETGLLACVDIRERLSAYMNVGNIYAVRSLKKDAVIAMYGDYQCSPGVLQVWMLFNLEAGRYAKTIIKEMRRQIAMRLTRYHRLQTYLFMGEREAKYIELLGFHKESVLEAFGPRKEDAMIYALVIK